MPVKIRLARHGRKSKPYYHIVIADSRAPRDGRFIERVGSYNPNTNPATIDLEFDRALYWLQTGAQPTDTARAILSYKGVMYKNHLLKGVTKGALTEEQAEEKFTVWTNEKESKIQGKVDQLVNNATIAEGKRFEAETKIKEARTEAIAKRKAESEQAAVSETETDTENEEAANQDGEKA